MEYDARYPRSKLIHSDTAKKRGIKNDPPLMFEGNLKRLSFFLGQLEGFLRKPIRVNSAYRSPELNRAIKGATYSQHMEGNAADIAVDGMTPSELAEFIRLNFDIKDIDQLIDEPTWVHVGLRGKNGIKRGQMMTMRIVDGKPCYRDVSSFT